MTGTGVIISKEGNLVQIRVQPGLQCVNCKACMWKENEPFIINARNTTEAKVGEAVLYEVKPRFVLGYSALIFIFPILSILLGYYAGITWLPQPETLKEGYGVLGGMVGFAFALFLIWLYDKKWAKGKETMTRVLGRVSEVNYQGAICNE
ncbi:SoxR reducing system RseC family protein [candidate division KSB1 bacterium]|nr:SoxR reducing system RseC family protein [candidate division KSB1 bacterium]